MPGITRIVRLLFLVLMTGASLVPGGLAMTICLCSDVAATSVPSDGPCSMVCCQARHEGEPGTQRAVTPQHDKCDDCRTISSGERDPMSSETSTVELLHIAALPPASSMAVIVPAVAVQGRLSLGCSSPAPPGRFSGIPLRI